MFWFAENSQVDGIIAIISISLQANKHHKQRINKLVEPKYVTDNPKCAYLMKNSSVFSISIFCSDLMTLSFIKKMSFLQSTEHAMNFYTAEKIS